jgi:hypothetical protein
MPTSPQRALALLAGGRNHRAQSEIQRPGEVKVQLVHGRILEVGTTVL